MSYLHEIIPNPVRSLPWRIRWLSGTEAYAKEPVTCLGKLARWTALELLGRDAEFATADGHRLRSTARNFTSLSVYLTGLRDPELQAFISRRLSFGDIFIDVGANIGVYTVFASKLVGETGKVLSIEANPKTYEYLSDNISINSLKNVELVNCAAGDAPGELQITSNADNAGEDHISASSEKGISVSVETLDELLPRLGIEQIHYMKIDVEGFELPVLRGAARTIGNSPSLVVQTELIEAHAQRYGHAISAIVDLMTEFGLKPFYANADGDALPIPISDIPSYCDVLWMRENVRA